MKTLIVESDLMSQCVLAKLLGERGHETTCFENAEQAILAYQKEFYPLVFVDVDLPGMGGVQFCRWLRSQEQGDKTYVMLGYSAGKADEVHAMLGAGASDFLAKPFEVGGLKLRLEVAERQMNTFFRATELQEQLQRRSEESEGLQIELVRAGESLIKEVEERRRVEDQLEAKNQELLQAKEAFGRKLKSQAEELCNSADQLQSVTAFRSKVEDDLKRVRAELELQTGKHAEELEAVRKELASEKARSREVLQNHQRGTEGIQGRLNEASATVRKAEERRQAAELEARRLADSLNKSRTEWEQQRQELVQELSALRERVDSAGEERTNKEVEQLTARCSALQQELGEVREGLAHRTEVHTKELLRLDAELQKALAARQQTEMQLVEVREVMAQQAQDYASAVLKAGQEVEKAVADRVRVVRAADEDQVKLREELRRLQLQSEELSSAKAGFEKERSELEQELQKAWTELERRTASPESGPEELQQALALAQETVKNEQEQRRRLEQALAAERARMQERLRRFAAALEPSEQDLVPAA